MASWRDEYLAALQVRNSKEKASKQTFDSYTRLADRAASLNTGLDAGVEMPQRRNPLASKLPSKDKSHTGTDGLASSPNISLDAAKIRQDLGEAQRSREELQAHLTKLTEELDKLRLQSRADSKRIHELFAETTSLTMRIKDRDEELRGKAKLLEDVHDETLSLTIQLNMAEEETLKLRKDNKDLVDRWMARKSQEADAVNNASKFS